MRYFKNFLQNLISIMYDPIAFSLKLLWNIKDLLDKFTFLSVTEFHTEPHSLIFVCLFSFFLIKNLTFVTSQLLDFRVVVARMLGLDINTLAVPDYEIISRLEKLIEAHHTTAFTTLSLEEALQDVQDGTANELRAVVAGTDTVITRSRERSRRKAQKLRTRARSASPMRRDPRQY